MNIYIQVNEKNRIRSWGTTRSDESDVEVQVEDNHPIFYSAPELFVLREGQIVKDELFVLENAKIDKLVELNEACNQAILDGFTHTIDGIDYHFSFDFEAQFNFHAAQTLFENGTIDNIVWTAKRNGEYTRVPIDKQIMGELAVHILQHKNGNISKYRDFLEPIVQSATTIEEVNSIKWDSL